MATTAADFEELLGAESLVDIEKLRSSARYGIPDEVRGHVWKLLLGVESIDKRSEESQELQHADKYREYSYLQRDDTQTLKRVRGETSRYCWRRKKEFDKAGISDFEQTIENVVSIFVTVHQQSQPEVLVPVCGPLTFTMGAEAEVYFALERLMSLIDEFYSVQDLNQRLANFLVLFRVLLPELYNHFEEEEVNFREWATSWFQYFLSRELPLECVLRLWDTYFSIPDGLGFHGFVCLAILFHCKEDLEELEQSEIHSSLFRLPAFDMDKIISQAFRIKYEAIEKSLAEYISL
eukprot:jgi/Hompol1/1377/HPOL_005585-RA